MIAPRLTKAILFDANEKTVKEVDYDGELDTLYVYLNCDLVDTIRLDQDHIIFVDDEGLLKDNPIGWAVEYGGNQIHFVGSGLLVGDACGMDCSVSLDRRKLKIACLRKEAA
jgi:hypothetical protein